MDLASGFEKLSLALKSLAPLPYNLIHLFQVLVDFQHKVHLAVPIFTHFSDVWASSCSARSWVTVPHCT